VDGKRLFIGPKESIKIQESIGADIIFAFDECTSPFANYEYTKKSLIKTHEWAKVCLKTKKSKQALYGIVQGGKFEDLRAESAKFIGTLPFDGFGIGGEFGDDKKTMQKMLKLTNSFLPENKPRHLLGIGHPEDLEPIISEGVETFDCIVPTHYARHGVAFTPKGKLNMKRQTFLDDNNPLDKTCICLACTSYSKAYICHLLRSNEITGLKLLTIHNLTYFNKLVEEIKDNIKAGKL